MKIKIIKGDITQVPATVIVNPANNMLLAGLGVSSEIYRAAGYELNCETTDIIARNGNRAFDTGSCHMTDSFRMTNCKSIIHAVQPVYNPALSENIMEALLAKVYENALRRAFEINAKSIAFPPISTGMYGYPMVEALTILKEVLIKTPYDGTVKFVLNTQADFKAYKSEISPWKIHIKRITR